MTPLQAADEMRRLSQQLDEALADLEAQVTEYADAERCYRQAKAMAWVSTAKGTVAEREAVVNSVTSDERHRRDLADGMRQAALESVRSRRAQISALQTLMNGHRAEAEYVRTGPGVAA